MGLIGDRLREARTKRGFTQAEIAQKLGVTRSVIARYESGINDPPSENISKLAEILGVSADWLLGRNEKNRDQPNPSTPSWWYRDTPPTDVELEEFLKKANVYFDGAPLDEEDKEDILTYLKVKWEREKRKREKEDKR